MEKSQRKTMQEAQRRRKRIRYAQLWLKCLGHSVRRILWAWRDHAFGLQPISCVSVMDSPPALAAADKGPRGIREGETQVDPQDENECAVSWTEVGNDWNDWPELITPIRLPGASTRSAPPEGLGPTVLPFRRAATMPNSPDYAEVERLNRKLRACAALLQRENLQLRAMVSNLLSLESSESTPQSSMLSSEVNGRLASSALSPSAVQEAACRRLLSRTSPLHVKHEIEAHSISMLEELPLEHAGSVRHAAAVGEIGDCTSWSDTRKAGLGVHRHTDTRGYVPEYVAFGEDSYNHWVAKATRDAKQAARDEIRTVANWSAAGGGVGAYRSQGSGRNCMDGGRVFTKGM